MSVLLNKSKDFLSVPNIDDPSAPTPSKQFQSTSITVLRKNRHPTLNPGTATVCLRGSHSTPADCSGRPIGLHSQHSQASHALLGWPSCSGMCPPWKLVLLTLVVVPALTLVIVAAFPELIVPASRLLMILPVKAPKRIVAIVWILLLHLPVKLVGPLRPRALCAFVAIFWRFHRI